MIPVMTRRFKGQSGFFQPVFIGNSYLKKTFVPGL
jgi:hypothetical protein